MREDEFRIEVNGFLIVLCRLSELALDEMQLCPVVVDIRVVGILLQGKFKVCLGLFRIAYSRMSDRSANI